MEKLTGMMTFRRHLVLASQLLLAACSATPMRVVVVFPDVGGLQVGDAVKVGKTHVGQVVELKAAEHEQVAVALQIDSPYRERVTEDAEIRVKRSSLLGGGRYVAIEPGVGPVAKQGARLQGREALWTELTGWAKEIGAWLEKPELRAKVQAFARSVSDTAKQGREAFDEARPALERQAAELLDLARQEGPEIATRVKSLLDGLLAEPRP